MNSFCRCLREALIEKFNIYLDIYVSKKREVSPSVLNETINFL